PNALHNMVTVNSSEAFISRELIISVSGIIMITLDHMYLSNMYLPKSVIFYAWSRFGDQHFPKRLFYIYL
ncbi:MAG: hypothetical protein V1850_06240, partial [Candidatus Bathyarchaeota archaeon]